MKFVFDQLTNLNWLGVLAAFAAYFLLGALWFTLFFNKAYRASLGWKEAALPNKPIFIVGPAICCLLITIASALLIYALRLSTLSDAVGFALLAGVGYLVSNTVNIAINPNMPRPIFYSMISGAYHLTGILIVSVILVLFK